MADYIVVGAGAAGCVLAGRLSEDPEVKVTVLEAGGSSKKLFVKVPAGFARLFKSESDWAYFTEPEAALGGRRLFWPRGKMLGGSSSMNAMIYIRGVPSDYDGWAAAGCTGWGFRDVLPYFKKAERNRRGGTELRGHDGALHVGDLRFEHEVTGAFLAACAQLGLPRNDDFNGPRQEGFGRYQVNQHEGRRFSAYDAYLAPALRRPNLEVRTNAQVTRLLIERGRCRGVEYVSGSGKHRQVKKVYAAREVLLAGGAINSPQLLLASGIGPADELRALGIEVVADRPGVGKNLQDHPIVGMNWTCERRVTLDSADSWANTLRFLLRGEGPLTSNVAEAGGFWKSEPGLKDPDLQFIFAPAWFVDHGFTRPEGHGLSMGPILLRPESRGEIVLASADARVAPRIFANYLSAARDRAALVKGLKLMRELAREPALIPYRGAEQTPGTKVRSDEELARYVGEGLETLYHPVGTCKMGIDEDSVVNAELRVHEVEGLRVIDASIMPSIVGGNTHAPTLMIAEKGAAIVRGGSTRVAAAVA